MNRLGLLLCGSLAAVPAFAASPAPAADPRVEKALARMDAAEKGAATLRFFFTQTTIIKITGEKQVLAGKASFKRPSSFRVEHLSPRPLTAVSDGKTLWVYNPGLNQVMVDKWENWSKSAGFPQGLGPFQEGAGELRKKYDVACVSASLKEDLLKFTPKDPGAWPYTLLVALDASTGLPVRMDLESQSLKTVTLVQRIELNPVLADDVFTFKNPPGADVLGTPAAEGNPK